MRKREIDRQALIARIRDLDGLTSEEKSDLIELVNTKKKYGLVWENKPERVEEEMRSKIPVFTEVKDRAIVHDTGSEKYPNHILIEGDNLQALTTLAYTHEGKIDVIYIDPPYNTGNTEKEGFRYNDDLVGKDDSYRHSKWLSFMSKRLEIAKKLLSEKGVIFISIGDDEQANLKILCDGVFDYIAVVPRISKKGSDQGTYFRPTKDYVLVYAKSVKNVSPFIDTNLKTETKQYKLLEGGRSFRKGHSLYQASLDPLRGCKNQRYYIEAPDGTLIIPPGELPEEKIDGGQIVPKTRKDKVWRWSKESYFAKKHLIMFSKSSKSPLIDSEGNSTEWNVYEKKYQDEECAIENNSGSLPNDVIYNYTNSLATTLMNEMGIDFSFSKPYELIKYLVEITHKNNNITILDFFAGSGTTLHATMQLNAEDGGNRQCILVTNNENNICEEVTYERNKRVIEGYTTPKGEAVEGLHGNNLRYYKTELVERDNSQSNRIALMKASADLLCIKEDIYTEQDELNGTKYNKKYVRFFQDGDRSMLLVFDPRAIEHVVARLAVMDIAQPVKVYVYSADEYPYTDDFEEVADKVELVALPTALRKALQNVLPAIGETQTIDENEVITETGEE